MSVKAMAGVIAAVAFTVVAARDVAPGAAQSAAWSIDAPLRVNGALPPGHPPVPSRGLPQGHPPIDGPQLPDGHPPIPWAGDGCPGQRAMPDAGIVTGRDSGEVIST